MKPIVSFVNVQETDDVGKRNDDHNHDKCKVSNVNQGLFDQQNKVWCILEKIEPVQESDPHRKAIQRANKAQGIHFYANVKVQD